MEAEGRDRLAEARADPEPGDARRLVLDLEQREVVRGVAGDQPRRQRFAAVGRGLDRRAVLDHVGVGQERAVAAHEEAGAGGAALRRRGGRRRRACFAFPAFPAFPAFHSLCCASWREADAAAPVGRGPLNFSNLVSPGRARGRQRVH